MGSNFAPGHAEDQSLYRSNLAGMFSIIVFLSLIVEFFHVKEGRIEVVCDGIKVLRSIYHEFNMVKGGANSFDLVVSARKYLSLPPLKWTFQHVKGHQDKPHEEFDLLERLNDDCDEDSGVFWELCVSQNIPTY
jgi:hypothetical protein